MKSIGLIFVIGLLTRAFSAPTNINVDKKAGPRVSTKEILTLEQQLKAQAGEDKKFYPSEMKTKHVPPQHQVDGLEDEPGETISQSEEESQGSPGISSSPADGVSESDQLHKLVEPLPEQFVPLPDQLDLAQLDELEAAEKRQHQHMGKDEDSDEKNMDKEASMPDIEVEGSRGYPGGDVEDAEDSDPAAEEDLEEERELEGQEEDEQAFFIQSVISALRDRPDLLQQYLQAGREDQYIDESTRVPDEEDNADRSDVIRAEYLEAVGGGQGWGSDGDSTPEMSPPGRSYMPSEMSPSGEALTPVQVDSIHQLDMDEQENELAQQPYHALENYQQFKGDRQARVVKKNFNPFKVRGDPGEKKSSERSVPSEFEETEDSSDSERNDSYNNSSEEDGDNDEQQLEYHKRVDMSQHLVM